MFWVPYVRASSGFTFKQLKVLHIILDSTVAHKCHAKIVIFLSF